MKISLDFNDTNKELKFNEHEVDYYDQDYFFFKLKEVLPYLRKNERFYLKFDHRKVFLKFFGKDSIIL